MSKDYLDWLEGELADARKRIGGLEMLVARLGELLVQAVAALEEKHESSTTWSGPILLWRPDVDGARHDSQSQ